MIKCKYAVTTKSGRFKCTYDDLEITEKGGEDKNSPSTQVKMCPYQHYCQKLYVWEHVNQSKCSNFRMEVESDG